MYSFLERQGRNGLERFETQAAVRVGQPERALQYDWQALEQIDPASNSVRQTWRIYLYTTRALASLNLFESASQYGAEMLDLASNELKP